MGQPRQHIRRTDSEWRTILERFDQSAQSQRDFCKAEGVSLASFLRWRRRLGASSAAATRSPFVELVHPPVDSAWSIEIDLPGGCTLRVRP